MTSGITLQPVQAGDKDFKDELGKIADMEVWNDAKDESARSLKAERDLLVQAEGEVQYRTNSLARFQAQVSSYRTTLQCADFW